MGTDMSKEAMKLALDALTHLQPTALTSFYTIGDRDKAITALREALAEQPAQQQEQKLEFVSPGGGYVPAIPKPIPLDWKLVPRKATPEMLKAMDECAQEGYDERLYAGMASSVYMAAWDASPVMGTLPEQPAQQQEPVANCNGMPAIEGPLSASQNGVYPWFMKWNKCADFWAHYMCINEQAQEDRAYEAKRWIERMRQAAELKPQTPEKVAEHADGTITVRVPPQDYKPAGGTQVSKVWCDGEKLMAKPIPLDQFYKEPVQQEPEPNRVKFERHWRNTRGEKKANRELPRHPLQPQTYIQDSANRHWVTWQAAVRSVAPPASKPLTRDELRHMYQNSTAWQFYCDIDARLFGRPANGKGDA